jgi:flagellum-specific ATP synthase
MAGELPSAAERWTRRLVAAADRVRQHHDLRVEGVLDRMVGMTLEAIGCSAPVGGRCLVTGAGGERIEAEVVGFAAERLFLMPTGDIHGLTPGAKVVPLAKAAQVDVGPGLLGRVLDGAGQPLDGRGGVAVEAQVRLAGTSSNPLERQTVSEPLDVGVRSINALLSVGRGQRLGLFAASGLGKSILLGMMTRYTAADVIVVGLVGERGREVKEFVEQALGSEGMRRAVVIATPADHPPLMRLHGAMRATAVAEYFRDRGQNVLLLMDSLTRFAQAQREIALAIGEPPATKGYPPSVFARLPQLVERAGNGPPGSGSITAIYTVLVEGDDPADPIAEAARAILDGHIVLSRQLAESGIYPAIEIESSVSRTMQQTATSEQRELARRFRELYATYQHHRDLITVGAYRQGSDPRVDEAVRYWPRILRFLRQDMAEAVALADSIAALKGLLGNDHADTGR